MVKKQNNQNRQKKSIFKRVVDKIDRKMVQKSKKRCSCSDDSGKDDDKCCN